MKRALLKVRSCSHNRRLLVPGPALISPNHGRITPPRPSPLAAFLAFIFSGLAVTTALCVDIVPPSNSSFKKGLTDLEEEIEEMRKR
jgi:hypothetical protein